MNENGSLQALPEASTALQSLQAEQLRQLQTDLQMYKPGLVHLQVCLDPRFAVLPAITLSLLSTQAMIDGTKHATRTTV